jgi:hypothetical protein
MLAVERFAYGKQTVRKNLQHRSGKKVTSPR